MKAKILPLIALLSLGATAARADDDASKTDKEKKKGGTSFEVAGVKFTAPADWKSEQPSSRMRKAQFKTGETEIVVFYFGKGQGGSAEANVARWLGQFVEDEEDLEPQSTTEDIKDKKVKLTTVSAKGTYLSGPPFGQKVKKPDYALRGVIVECADGPAFIKMTGPAKEVDKATKGFDKMIRGAFGLKPKTKPKKLP